MIHQKVLIRLIGNKVAAKAEAFMSISVPANCSPKVAATSRYRASQKISRDHMHPEAEPH